jgi:hypothetical protein
MADAAPAEETMRDMATADSLSAAASRDLGTELQANDTAVPQPLPEAQGEAAPVEAPPNFGSSGSQINFFGSSPKRPGRREPQLPAKESLKQTAANVIMQLAIDDDNKNTVREVGGLKRLVSLLTSPDTEVQLNVLGALTNLALNDQNKMQIRELQAIPQIIKLMDSPNVNVQEKVVEVIWNLAGNDENRVAILYAGGVQRLLELLNDSEESEDGGPNIVASGLGALANLTVHPENHVAIRDSGGIQKVVELLTGSSHSRTKERAANCIENLALDRENRELVRMLGGTAALVKLLVSTNDAWVCAAAGALKNLSVDEESREEIAKNDGLRELINMLKRADVARGNDQLEGYVAAKEIHWVIVGKSAECIGNFALEEAYRTKIRELDGVGLMLNLLEQGTPDEARLAAAGAILNLAVEDESKVVIRQAGGIAKLVPLLDANLPVTLRAVTAMTLTNLAVQQESALAIADVGGVATLIQCLGSPTDDVLQEKAASALWNLSAVENIKGMIRKRDGISFLLSVFETSKFVPAIENCLGTLVSLAETQENRFAISQAGAVGILIPLMSSENPTIIEKAAGVIWNLCHEETVQHTVRQLGGLKPLIALLSQDAPLIRFNAVGAMPLLTELEENINEAFDLDIVPPLIHLLATESNVLVLQNAAQTLGNIAEGNVKYQSVIREAQGLDRIVEVIDKWTPPPGTVVPTDPLPRSEWRNRQELLAKCCFAIWLICAKNEVNQSSYREAGGIKGLVQLMQPENDESLLEMAAGAICALCEQCDPNKNSFREHLGLETLIGLLDHTSDAVKLNASKALCHLSENDENRRIIRELGGIEKLTKLLSV